MKGKLTIFVLWTLLLVPRGVWAQATAQISGAVSDQSGAILPGVEVTVSQTDTGIARSAVTDETGAFISRTCRSVLIDWKRRCRDSAVTCALESCSRSAAIRSSTFCLRSVRSPNRSRYKRMRHLWRREARASVRLSITSVCSSCRSMDGACRS